MTISFKIKGIPKTTLYLAAKNKQSEMLIASAMNKVALFIESEVKQSVAGRNAEPTSVDTGKFLGSVKSKSSKESATIFSDVDYAKYLEYGTSRISPRRHFQNSLNRNKSKVNSFIQADLNKL